LSGGVPRALVNLHEQYCCRRCTPLAVRRKSRHFQSYEEVAKKFAKLLGMDPWLINPMYLQCGKVDFAPRGPGMRARQRRRAADADPPQVQGIRHQRETFVVVKATAAPTAWAS